MLYAEIDKSLLARGGGENIMNSILKFLSSLLIELSKSSMALSSVRSHHQPDFSFLKNSVK